MSLAASTAVHVALIVVLAWLAVGRSPAAAPAPPLDTRWQTPQEPQPLVNLDRPLADAVVSPTDGGREALSAARPAEPELPAIFPTLALNTPDRGGEQLFRDNLTEDVGSDSSGSEPGDDGRGTGAGGGEGDGDGRRFFGAEGHGRRFVYVVDRSSSMKHPHDSEAKTRFRRLKFELLASIGNMTPDMEFFIIFFNERARPMPASRLQPATPAAKQRYLDWMARVTAVGRTDPRAALELALRLQPDTIYFLSDGSFPHQVNIDLKNIRQRRVVIHTFALGDTGGQETLESLATNNGGRYHFVP